MENIIRERNPHGCDSLIPATPCRFFIWQDGEKVYVDVNPDEYKKVGSSKDFEYFTKIS